MKKTVNASKRDAIIASLLTTASGRNHIAAELTMPLRQYQDYEAIHDDSIDAHLKCLLQ